MIRTHVRGLFRSLSLRLLLSLLTTMAAVAIVFTIVNIRATSDRWMHLIHNSANRTSELVRRAAYYGMLLNRKEDVHQTIRQVAKSPGVAGIRVYDKQGTIIFSANDTEIGDRVDLQAEACVVCHDRDEPLRSLPRDDRIRAFRNAKGEGIVALITPIENEPECARSSCHGPPQEETILGVLDVQLSTVFMDETLNDTKRQMIWTAVAMALVIGLGSAAFIERFVRRPVRRLHDGTTRVARGDFSTRIRIASHDELGDLGDAFNRMTDDLQRARDELTGWSQRLEQKVVEKTDELGRAQRQILLMEKMASLGKLSATVAHELNNPLAGILTYAKLVARELKDSNDQQAPELAEELQRYLTLIQQESRRCGDIVRNLLLFARESGTKLAACSINDIVERSLMLVRHHLEMANIKLVSQKLDEDDQLICDADQLQQALVALFMNAVESMAEGGDGQLTVRLQGESDHLGIDVSDTGSGIPAEIVSHIFEPFFSTKDKESGVGLGLAVVYGIVQRHGGSIDVTSQVGEGATFHLHIPRRPPSDAGSSSSKFASG